MARIAPILSRRHRFSSSQFDCSIPNEERSAGLPPTTTQRPSRNQCTHWRLGAAGAPESDVGDPDAVPRDHRTAHDPDPLETRLHRSGLRRRPRSRLLRGTWQTFHPAAAQLLPSYAPPFRGMSVEVISPIWPGGLSGLHRLTRHYQAPLPDACVHRDCVLRELRGVGAARCLPVIKIGGGSCPRDARRVVGGRRFARWGYPRSHAGCGIR